MSMLAVFRCMECGFRQIHGRWKGREENRHFWDCPKCGRKTEWEFDKYIYRPPERDPYTEPSVKKKYGIA